MPSTRGAAKREAAFLQESLLASKLSSPPVGLAIDHLDNTRNSAGGILAKSNKRSKTSKCANGIGDVSGGTAGVKETLPTPGGTTKKRKHTLSKGKHAVEPLTGGWDVLPHGLGKAGDLTEDAVVDTQNVPEATVLPPKKRARRGRSAIDIGVENSVMLSGVEAVKSEDRRSGETTTTANPKDESTVAENINIEGLSKPTARRGHAKKAPPTTPESSNNNEELDPVTTELLGETLPKKRGRRAKTVKAEDVDTDADVKNEDFKQDNPKKRQAQRATKIVDTSKGVKQKVDDLQSTLGNVGKNTKKGKANLYGLTPGFSPFPNHAMPTPEACEEVTRLLSELHGAVKPPEVIPPPSMEVTGCGEVPDLLDAILRTLLSASTTANNSNMALKGLKDRFGLRTSGVGEGSVNWEAVHEAKLEIVIESIKSGGLAKVKGTNIKKILTAVYERNLARLHGLLKEKEAVEVSDITGAKHESQEMKDLEIFKVKNNMLSMDHVFEMTTDEAMDEMTKLPGIGVKTASCVILFCMKRPSFAVDTHVWRHCKWLGWVPETATRDQTFSHCEVRVPDHLKYPLHQLFLRHGKTCGRCRANTSAGTDEWDSTVCPIDHLVTRKEKKKQPGAIPVKKAKAKKGNKSNETEESDIEISEHDDSDDE